MVGNWIQRGGSLPDSPETVLPCLHLVCRLLLEKKNQHTTPPAHAIRSSGAALKIHSRHERHDPPHRLLRQAVVAGCQFPIDTDAPAPGQLDWLDNGCSRAATFAVPAERVLNTWPVERLLEHMR